MSAVGSEPTAVVIVDDYEAVRAGIERLLQRAPDLRPMAALSDDQQLLSLLDRKRVDVVVLDYRLERGDGLSVCLRLKQRCPRPAVVIYSAYAGPWLAVGAAVAQADALISKAEPIDVLLDAIRCVARGERPLAAPAPDLLQAAASRLDIDDLPLMALLLDGAQTQEIAQALRLDQRTIKHRARRIIGMLQAGTTNRTTASHAPKAASSRRGAGRDASSNVLGRRSDAALAVLRTYR